MSPLDTESLRQAVADFAQRHPLRFQELTPARTMISELRQKGASFNTIAEILTGHGLAVGKTTVAAFCHEVLGERVRPRRRSAARKKPDRPAPPKPTESRPTSVVSSLDQPPLSALLRSSDSLPSGARPPRGPRIAKIELADPTD